MRCQDCRGGGKMPKGWSQSGGADYETYAGVYRTGEKWMMVERGVLMKLVYPAIFTSYEDGTGGYAVEFLGVLQEEMI